MTSGAVPGTPTYCTPAPLLNIKVSSDEQGAKKGKQSPGWEIIDQGDGLYDVWVKAARNGKGKGRTYAIFIDAVDEAGNPATSTLQVHIGHDKGKKGGHNPAAKPLAAGVQSMTWGLVKQNIANQTAF